MSKVFTLKNPTRRRIGNIIWPISGAAYFLLLWLSPESKTTWGYALIALIWFGVILKLSSGRWHWPSNSSAQ
jgi:hypothetical protein